MFAAASNFFEWLMGKLPVVIFVIVFLSQIVRGLMRSRADAPEPQAKPDELEEQRRTQEVQEQIRRRIAERRGGAPAQPAPQLRSEPAPAPPRRMETTQMPEPFGGPLRRVLEELQLEVQPPPVPPPLPPVPVQAAVENRNAELERQVQLAEKLRELEESRLLMKRRATQPADTNYAATRSEGGRHAAGHGQLLDELRDPASLRRAFVLREVLGPPVALR